MLNRQLTYQKLADYMKALADNHTAINSFISYSEKELATEMRKRQALTYPALVLFGYSGKLDGNKQRTFAERSIAFAIVSKVNKRDDFQAQYQAINDAEQIGLSILSRINYDSKQPVMEWLYNAFDKNSVRFSEITGRETDNLFGMEFHFELKNKEPLIIDAADWADIDTTC